MHLVLGPTVQKTLFGSQSGLDQKIRIKGEIYQVIGITEAKGSQGPMDRDDSVFIPLTTMSARIVVNNALTGISVNTIYVKGEDQNHLKAAHFQISNLLRLRHNIQKPEDDDFKITNQADLIQTFSSIVALLTVFVVAIVISAAGARLAPLLAF
jgi:putative ABC transport system permease protein